MNAGNAAQQTKKVCDALAAEGLLTPEQYENVLQTVQRSGERPEEVLLELAYVSEPDLLRVLASYYRTRFITTERLARADIDKPTLDLVPRRFAEQTGIFPVLYDPQTKTLSVATADPDDTEVLGQLQAGSGLREVKPIVARPAAVRAGIAKAYQGDIHAFALVDRNAQMQLQSLMNQYERNVVSDASMATSLASEKSSRERMMTEQQLMNAANKAPMSSGGESSSSWGELLELLNVMVSLLENGRGDLRGHSAETGRLMRRMVDRLAVPPAVAIALVAAAYVHDIGKTGQFHLTALNVGEYDGHKVAAQKAYATPSRLLEGIRFPDETRSAVDHMYERFDGTGFPDKITGKDIPLGARLLAICDTYSDLVQNNRNPFRKALSPEEACAVIEKLKGSIFDPNLAELFRHTVVGEDLKARLLANRYVALIVDVDPEETTVLELRMIEQGFVVKTARSADQAAKLLQDEPPDLVVSEIDLPGRDGLTLLQQIRATPTGKNLNWVIYTRRQNRADAQKAFELGVLDYVSKPTQTDVLVAKLKALLGQRAAANTPRGVSGSLKEMGLPDIVQVLFHGRKSGNLRIQADGSAGEIHFQDGAVVNALWGNLRGEDAFYAMLGLADGDFGLDPAFKPTARVINESSEALLLEGMRRLDEGAA